MGFVDVVGYVAGALAVLLVLIAVVIVVLDVIVPQPENWEGPKPKRLSELRRESDRRPLSR